MELSRLRILGAATLAMMLIGSPALAPAGASTDTVVTVKGHVVDREGEPVSGITVGVSCSCVNGADRDTVSASDKTDRNGFYSLAVYRDFVKYIEFTDPDDDYFPARKSDATSRASGATYTIDVTLKRISRITGTVTAINGGRAGDVVVEAHDALTGKRRVVTYAHRDGTFEMRVEEGDYRVRFGGGLYTYAQWYGEAATEAESPMISVGYGGIARDIDGSVTPKPTIQGTVIVDGKLALDDVKEHLVVTVTDETGWAVEGSVFASGGYFIGYLRPGALTVTVRPTRGSGSWIQPYSQEIYLAPHSAISGLDISVNSIPASATDTRSTSIFFQESTSGRPQSGKRLAGKITLQSYGDVTGGTVKIYVDGKKVATRRVPSSGRFNWSYTPKKVDQSNFFVTARYFGTETTRSRSSLLYGMGGE